MSSRTKTDACPRCCPDGGAILEAIWDEGPKWECRNCGRVLPRRIVKVSGKMTPTQERWVERIKKTMGECKVTMIGRKAFVSARREGNLVTAAWLSGTVGSHGALNLRLGRLLGADVQVTTDIQFSVYVERN